MRLIIFVFGLALAAAAAWWWFLGPRTTTVDGVVGPANSINITAYVRSDAGLGGLGPGFDGRAFRLRYWDIKPGGVVPLHSHRGRPATIYVVNGEILEFRNGAGEPVRHRGGEISSESGGLVHHWRNLTGETVHLVASDIYADPKADELAQAENVRTVSEGAPVDAAFEDLAAVDLAGEGIGVSGYTLRTRRVAIAPGGDSGPVAFSAGPGNAFVLEGAVVESRSDAGADAGLSAEQSGAYAKGATVRWRNAGTAPAVLIVSDIAATAGPGSAPASADQQLQQ